MNNEVVNIFPINQPAFGLSGNWFESVVPKFIEPAYLLLTLLLVISVGIMALRRFEDVNLEKKVWNIPVIIVLIALWPFLVVGLKGLVDAFNTFLATEIFRIQWKGFGWPEIPGGWQFFGWSIEAIARFLPVATYWIVYAFFMIFFFFFAVLGPFILAKGVLFDEIESFLELLKEITILFLWQTTLLILVGLILPEIVSGESFPQNPSNNIFFLSLILGVMILFVPSMTRKFGNHLGSSFFPPGLKWGGLMLGITAASKLGAGAFAVAGAPLSHNLLHRWHLWKHRVLSTEDLSERYRHKREAAQLEAKNLQLENRIHRSHSIHQSQHDHQKNEHHRHEYHRGTPGYESLQGGERYGLEQPTFSKFGSVGDTHPRKYSISGSRFSQSSLARHFKPAFGAEPIDSLRSKSVKRAQFKEDRMIEMLKKAKEKSVGRKEDESS